MFGCSLQLAFELAFCFFVFLLVCRVEAQTTQSTFQPIFNQEEFVRNGKSKEMLQYLNLSVNPCEDFYAYACGNWPKYNSKLKKKATNTIEQLLRGRVDQELQFLLNEKVTLTDGLNGRKIKDFYKSCNNALANGPQQQSFFSEFIKLNGGFPAVPGSNWDEQYSNYDWQEITANLRYHYHMDIFIGINVESNPYNLNEDTIFLTEPSTILPKDLCNTQIDRLVNLRRKEYDEIERDVANNLKSWLSIESPEAEKLAYSILVFEWELCRGMTGRMDDGNSESDSYMNYTRRSLPEFTHYFNDSMDFYRFISRSYDLAFPRPVSMRSEQYYKTLLATIPIHSKSTVANYIMYRALSILSFPSEDNRETRPKFCTQIIRRYFPQILGYMYYQKIVTLKTKNDVEGVFEKLKIAFENSLHGNWIQEYTSRLGRKKLDEITLYLPKYEQKINLNHLSINATHYWHNLAQVMSQPRAEEFERLFATENLKPRDEIEAYDVRVKYRSRHKRIDIGWALLQPPYYHQAYPHSMIYATIGQRLAQELAHAFNELGWTSDALNLDNWDHITALAYQNRSECFREQFSFYLSNNANSFQNVTQLREFIAMSAGVNVAFAAYLNWLEFLNPNNDFTILRRETLPELNFSNTQLFFIAFAQMQCHFERSNATFIDFLPLYQHSPERYKVNGPLWNSMEFGKEFGCPLGAEMNSAEKCIIY